MHFHTFDIRFCFVLLFYFYLKALNKLTLSIFIYYLYIPLLYFFSGGYIGLPYVSKFVVQILTYCNCFIYYLSSNVFMDFHKFSRI